MQSTKTPSLLAALAAEARRVGADELEIDYKDGCERVFAMKGAVGVGIASYVSGTELAKALLKELRGIGRKGKLVDALGTKCRLTVTRFDSFGEEAFRGGIEPV
jgi:hypothetical protein